MYPKHLDVKFWYEPNCVITERITNPDDIRSLIRNYYSIPIYKLSSETLTKLARHWSINVKNEKFDNIFDKIQYKIPISVPEPMPKNEGISITPLVLDWLRNRNFNSTTELIYERHNYGLQKYGQELMSNDGRNEIEDARQELGDLLQYLTKAKVNKCDLKEVKAQLDEPLQAVIKLYQELIAEEK